MQQIPLTLDHVFTVSELNTEVKWLLDTQFGNVWVEGELSNTMRARTGHLYFTVKDSRSQLRCAMFRNDNRRIRFTPTDGQKVLCRGRLGIYEARGDYQLVVEHMVETGAGALQQKLEETRRRLHAEGLFDEAQKKPLPPFPTAIGLITSPTGAAVRDVLNVLKRRCVNIPVIVYPATVQGNDATPTIVKALEVANRRDECDVLLLVRGGGSLEDLWAFNEEAVARAIHASSIPVVSGVGHEVDYSIADLAADLRAPTPSAAAELCSPDRVELLQQLRALSGRLHRCIQSGLSGQNSALQRLLRRLANRHPSVRLQQRAQRCDELEMRLIRAIGTSRQRAAANLSQLTVRLGNQSPVHQFRHRRAHIAGLQQRLVRAISTRTERSRLRLSASVRALQVVSPVNTLDRGYAIVHSADNSVVTSRTRVAAGDALKIRLADGNVSAEVTGTSAQK